jgi:hypothetical protein
MSISVSPRSSGTAANATRQQLDELDALLQRMLDLPVNKLDAPEASPVAYAVTEAVAAPDVAVPPPIAPASDAQAKASDESWVPLSSTWQPSAMTWKPLARSWSQAATDPAPEQKDTVPAETPTAPQPATSAPVAASVPIPTAPELSAGRPEQAWPDLLDVPADRPAARWALLLVAFNRVFDLCLAPLGPAGRFFRGRPGRLGLAILGLGCLVAAAVVLLIDWAGWTS